MTEGVIIRFKRNALLWIIIISIASVLTITSTQNVMESFIPRSIVFNNSKLTFFHVLTCIALGIIFIILSVYNWTIYRRNRGKKLMLSQFWGLFAGRSFWTGIVFLMEAVNVFWAYYWIDLIIRIIAVIFASAVLVAQIKYFKFMVDLPSRTDVEDLLREIRELKAEKKIVQTELDTIKRKNRK